MRKDVDFRTEDGVTQRGRLDLPDQTHGPGSDDSDGSRRFGLVKGLCWSSGAARNSFVEHLLRY